MMFYAAVLALGFHIRNRRRHSNTKKERNLSREASSSDGLSQCARQSKTWTMNKEKTIDRRCSRQKAPNDDDVIPTNDCVRHFKKPHTVCCLCKIRMELLQSEKEMLSELNAALYNENQTLRRIASLLSKSARLAMVDLLRDTQTVTPNTLSVNTSLDNHRRRSSSQGRLPSLVTLTRINLRFNREQHFGGLHRAVLSGKEDDVEYLLSAGKDINAHDEYGKTPLHCAVGAQKLDIVLCLLRHKPDIDAHDDREDAPLHTAIRTGNIAIVTAILLDGRADPNACGHTGCKPLHVAAQLDHVNNTAICKLLLENGAKLLKCDNKKMTPLALATLHGFYDVMVCLFSYAAVQGISKDDLLHEVDGEGSTLLHLGVESGSARVVELCLDEGAAPHSVKSSDGSTPVHLASSYGYMDILDILMKAVAFILDPPPDQDGRLPIHKAAQANHHQVLSYLLKQDLDQIDAVDHERCTPIMLAAENKCCESVRVLLANKANIDIRDSRNRTVLHYAIGSAEIMKEILKDVKSTSLIRTKDDDGNTPLHYASGRGCVKDISLMLMKYKASVAITNGSGEIPLHIAARYGWLLVVKKLTEGRNKRTINSTDASERTPLHLAAREGHEDLIEFFLRKNARIDKDINGQTPLHYAAYQGSQRSLQLFLEAKPDTLNITDEERNTALHRAAMGGHPHIVDLLLSKIDQLVTVNERNQNVLDIAIESKHDAVAMVIAEHKRWREALRSTLHGTHTQIQLLVRFMPDVAKKILDRCVEKDGDPDDENYKVTYDLRFIQGMPEEKKNAKNIKDSLSALHTMVKYKTLPCLTHPLCSVLMDIKWRKFGLVCAFLNQGVFLIYIVLICIMMKNVVSQYESHGSSTNNTTKRKTPLIISAFNDAGMGFVCVILMVSCVYNLSKEVFQIKDEGWKYFLSINNWLEVTLYVLTIVTLFRPGLVTMAVCVFLAWIVLLHYISKFNYVGLYIVMIRKTIKTVLKVLVILLILLAAFAFSFHVITADLRTPSSETRFRKVSTAMAATFFMMLDNLQYEQIVLNYTNIPSNEGGSYPIDIKGVVLYSLFIGYCFMMPIIFLNLLIGLAVGDIDSIRKTAAMERYTSQVEHLSQLERALPTFILNKAQVQEYIEYPNRHKKLKDKLVDSLVKLLSPRQEEEKKTEGQTDMDEKISRHEAQLKQISATLKSQSALLEELRDMLVEKKSQSVALTAAPLSTSDDTTTATDSTSEFYV